MAQVHERMAQVMSDLSYIPKGTSQGVSYAFRGIDALFNELHKHLADAGLFLSPRVLDDWQVNMIAGTNNRMQTQALFRVCVDVYAPDGSMVTLGPGLAQSHDYGDKAVYQAQQNAVKYVLLEAFAIPTEEQDQDARPADDVPAFSLKDHIAQGVAQFGQWDDERRRLEWKEATEGPVRTQDDVAGVLARMAVAYAAEFPVQIDGQAALDVEA